MPRFVLSMCVLCVFSVTTACSVHTDRACPPEIVSPEDGAVISFDGSHNLVLSLYEPLGGETWSFSAPSIPEVERSAEIYQSGDSAVFRWAPLASHYGDHDVTFTVDSPSCGASDSVTVTIRVPVPVQPPRFIQPPPGGAHDLNSEPCITVDIEVIDEDSENVMIHESAPFIDGGSMRQTDGHRATWEWCPTQEQIDESLHYSLYFEADDGDHEPVGHAYDIVLLVE